MVTIARRTSLVSLGLAFWHKDFKVISPTINKKIEMLKMEPHYIGD